MKILLTILFTMICMAGIAQIASSKKVEKTAKVELDPIKLKPTQKKVLADLDSARAVFNKDVESSKDAINTFNALMQRSNALGGQQKQAYDLIMEAWGYDPNKYVVKGVDLKKGEIQVRENK